MFSNFFSSYCLLYHCTRFGNFQFSFYLTLNLMRRFNRDCGWGGRRVLGRDRYVRSPSLPREKCPVSLPAPPVLAAAGARSSECPSPAFPSFLCWLRLVAVLYMLVPLPDHVPFILRSWPRALSARSSCSTSIRLS